MGPKTNHRVTLFLLTASLVIGCARHAPVASPAAPVAPPRLLVTIVVDQLAAWMAAERWPQLPPDGGFARLRREGLYVEDLRYEHSVTDTAPGHAALFTGNVPAQTGIFGNETIPSGGGPARSILADPTTQVVGVDSGVVKATGPGKEGSSLARLSGDTVADRFMAEVPGAQVFSVSLKDRATLFGSGRTPQVALWLDTDLGEFVTSTKFPAPPAWVAPLAGKAAVAAASQVGWRLSEAEQVWVQSHAETADDQPGEGSPAGLGDHFPHPIRSAKALRGTAQADVLLFGLARGAVEIARDNRRPTLLALSFSSNDYVGHIFGPHSWEAWDELYRLDRALADFLASLDGAFGPDGYAVMLSADHGSVALPELAGTANDPWCKHAPEEDRWQRACGPRRRVDTRAATAAVETALVAALGAGPWTIGIADPYLHLTAQARALPAERRALLIATVAQVLQPMGFAEVVDARAARPPCTRSEALADLLCAAISPRGDGDLYLVVRPGTFLGIGALEGHGINHGSPYLYDRSVPLLVRAPGRVAPGRVRHTPASFAAFARTASALLGVHAPQTDRPGEDLTVSSGVP